MRYVWYIPLEKHTITIVYCMYSDIKIIPVYIISSTDNVFNVFLILKREVNVFLNMIRYYDL